MEETIESISGFGKFQLIATALIGSTSMLNAMTVYSTVFTDAYPSKSTATNNQQLIASSANSSSTNTSTIHQPEIDPCLLESVFGLTSSIEWQLACSHVSYSYLLQTFFMVGSLGSLLMGFLSDRLGRRRVALALLASIAVTLGSSQLLVSAPIGLPVSAKYAIYSVSKLLLGTFCTGLFSVTYVLLFEIVSRKHVTLVSNVNVYLFVVGELAIALVSFVSRSWHFINWFMAAFASLVLFLAYFFLPESSRFLVVHARFERLYADLAKIAKINGKRSFAQIDQKDVIDSLLENFDKTDSSTSIKETTIFGYLYKSGRQICVRVFFLSFVWLSLSLVYFGISLGITKVHGVNPYLIFIISSVAEFVGYFMCHLNDRFRRKLVFVSFLLLAGLMSLLVSLLQTLVLESEKNGPESESKLRLFVLVAAVLIGKSMSSAAYNCAYVYTSLMFATQARNTLLNLLVGVGRIGAITAPMVNMLGDLVWKQLPYVFFSLTSFLGALCIFILPDPTYLNEF